MIIEFNIIIKKVYKNLLMRDPDSEAYSHYSNLLIENKLDEVQLIDTIKLSDEYKIIQNKREFVERIYRSVLNRQGDEPGIIYYVNSILNGTIKQENLEEILKNSPEFQQKTIKKYTTYGSCQADTLAQILNSNAEFRSKYEYIPTKRVKLLTEDDIHDLNDNVFSKLDLFIYQPIYNYHPHMSTKYIIENVLKPECIKIVFPFLHFTAYHPQTIAVAGIDEFTSYHDINLMKLYVEKNSINLDNFIETINSSNYYDQEYLMKLVNKNILNFRVREINFDQQGHYIPVSDFIINNYQKKLLFYTFNHPSKYILQYIVIEIFKYLNISISFDDNIDTLSSFIMLIYNSVHKNLNLQFEQHTTHIFSNIPFTKQQVFLIDINAYDKYCRNPQGKELLINSIIKWESEQYLV